MLKKLTIYLSDSQRGRIIESLNQAGFVGLAAEVADAPFVDPTDDGPEVAILSAERQS